MIELVLHDARPPAIDLDAHRVAFEIDAAVEAQCVPAFTEFVGVDYYESTLDFWWMTPTEETWTQANDRLVQCIVYEPDPADATGETSLEVTGSLEGAAR